MQERGDLAIGADGLRSKVRERLGFGAAEQPEFSGRVAFRATVPAERAAARASRARSQPAARRRRPSRPLSAARRLARQSRRDHRIRLARQARRRSLGRRGRLARAEARLRRLVARDAEPDRAARKTGAPGRSTRAPADRQLRGRPRRARRRRRASDGSRFSRKAPVRRSRTPGALGSALARRAQTSPPRSPPIRAERAPRAGRVQREALAQARIYHMSGPLALARDLAMRALGPERLLEALRLALCGVNGKPWSTKPNCSACASAIATRPAARCTIRISARSRTASSPAATGANGRSPTSPTLLGAPYRGEHPEDQAISAGLDFALIGVPMDLGVTNRAGARFGPRAVRGGRAHRPLRARAAHGAADRSALRRRRRHADALALFARKLPRGHRGFHRRGRRGRRRAARASAATIRSRCRS